MKWRSVGGARLQSQLKKFKAIHRKNGEDLPSVFWNETKISMKLKVRQMKVAQPTFWLPLVPLLRVKRQRQVLLKLDQALLLRLRPLVLLLRQSRH